MHFLESLTRQVTKSKILSEVLQVAWPNVEKEGKTH